MIYLEIYCTDGTGWRIAIRPEDVKISGGIATITNFPTLEADHPCELLDEVQLVTEDPAAIGKFVPLLKGPITLNKRALSDGETVYFSNIQLRAE